MSAESLSFTFKRRNCLQVFNPDFSNDSDCSYRSILCGWWDISLRNQRMTEDQSVVGRRRIYYDSDGNETLIASDSEEEDPGDDDDKEESKHDFTKGEDSLIWYFTHIYTQECKHIMIFASSSHLQ